MAKLGGRAATTQDVCSGPSTASSSSTSQSRDGELGDRETLASGRRAADAGGDHPQPGGAADTRKATVPSAGTSTSVEPLSDSSRTRVTW